MYNPMNNTGWRSEPTVPVEKLKQEFKKMAKAANVPLPKITFPKSNYIVDLLTGGITFGQFSGKDREILIYPKGHWLKNCKHEFIHYVRFTMGLCPNWMVLAHRVTQDTFHIMKDFEESRTRQLVLKPWPKILKELKAELVIKNATIGDLY